MPIFEHVVNSLNDWHMSNGVKKISQAEFEQWKKTFTFDAIQGLRYGQSFCNYFDITDYRLMYVHDPLQCDKIIDRDYLIHSKSNDAI